MVKQSAFSLDENDFQNILNGMVDGIITIDHRGIVLSFNKTAETMFGYQSAEVIGKNVSILMPEPEHSAHDSYIHNHVTTGVKKIIGIGREVTALRKNGKTFPMHLSVIEYHAKIDGERWFIGTCRDITLQKQQQEQLKRSLKMDAIGKLTSGLAHDYNNMLSVVLGFSELLSERIPDDPKALEYVDAIKQAAERASNLTQKLMSVSRKRTDVVEAIIINDILKQHQQMLAKTLTPKIHLLIKLGDDLWPVLMDKGCMEDVILNLSINAMHAMPDGGELKIATSNEHIDFLDAQVLTIPPGEYVKLAITDNGTGMTVDVVSHIFEPFYSTKGDKGTGLGLSQVYNYVTESKGTIRVYSESGQGTCFSIYLPRCVHDLSDKEENNRAELKVDELYGSASILVVDDEPALRELSEHILSAYGYKVICASSAKEALIILENETINLVLSDVIMPGMDGFELAHIIRHAYPEIKIQLCSGFSENKGRSGTNKTLAENLLTKPFTATQLLVKVQALLSG